MDHLTLEIQSLAFGGAGVGRLPDGRAVFVPFAAPGDQVRIRIERRWRTYARAELLELLRPGVTRCEPRCPQAGRCGGCPWQHIAIQTQRQWKMQLLVAELSRQIPGFSPQVLQPLSGGAEFGHRVRTRLHRRDRQFGTLAAHRHTVVAWHNCPILTPELEAFAQDMAAALAAQPPLDVDLELYVDAHGRRGLAVYPQSARPALPWPRLAAQCNVAALTSAGQPRSGTLTEDSNGRALEFVPGIFVQTNRERNAVLVQTVLAASAAVGPCAEVYAGAGNFTLHLADRLAPLQASEAHPTAAEWLRRNLADTTVAVRCETDAQSAADLATRPPLACLILDPPRAGIKPLYPLFERAAPHRVVLVSCHPLAAVRDLNWLIRTAGYRLQAVWPIDMFPQTDHLELAALLQR